MLLRIALALALIYMARELYRRRSEVISNTLPGIGRPQMWMIYISLVIVSVLAVFLFVGAWTQIAAIIAAIVILKHLVFFTYYSHLLPFPKSTYLLLLCICLSLLVTGAGAFALDLPL